MKLRQAPSPGSECWWIIEIRSSMSPVKLLFLNTFLPIKASFFFFCKQKSKYGNNNLKRSWSRKKERKKHKKTEMIHSLEVCFRFAFCAEAPIPSSVLENLAKVSAAVVLVHVEAVCNEGGNTKLGFSNSFRENFPWFRMGKHFAINRVAIEAIKRRTRGL